MATKDIPVNRDILLWARKEVNLFLERVANKAGIKEAKLRKDYYEFEGKSIRCNQPPGTGQGTHRI